jgi:hypothetical protein
LERGHSLPQIILFKVRWLNLPATDTEWPNDEERSIFLKTCRFCRLGKPELEELVVGLMKGIVGHQLRSNRKEHPLESEKGGKM